MEEEEEGKREKIRKKRSKGEQDENEKVLVLDKAKPGAIVCETEKPCVVCF